MEIAVVINTSIPFAETRQSYHTEHVLKPLIPSQNLTWLENRDQSFFLFFLLHMKLGHKTCYRI